MMDILRLLLRHSRLSFLIVTLAGVVGGVSLTFVVAVISSVLNSQNWWRSITPGNIIWYIFGAFMVGVFTFASGYLTTKKMQEILANLRIDLCKKVLESSLARIESLGSSTILAVLSEDLGRLSMGAFAFPILVVNFTICLAVIFYMGMVNAHLMIVVVFFQLLTIAIEWLYFQRYEYLVDTAVKPRNDLVRRYQMLAQGIKELKQASSIRQAFIDDLYNPDVLLVRSIANKINKVGIWIDSVAKIGFLLSLGATILYAGLYRSHISIDDVRRIVIAFLLLITPLSSLLNALPQIFEANGALKNINNLVIDDKSELTTSIQKFPEDAGLHAIGLTDVNYSYPQENNDSGFKIYISKFELKRGELVVLKGGNGYGKTTFAKLLAGLYLPRCGTQTINGTSIDRGCTSIYREQIGAIWSDNTLADHFMPDQRPCSNFFDNLWSNLGLNKFSSYRAGWNNSDAMSTGEQRRMALISVLLQNRPFIIFDEWAANQDKVYRTYFYNKLLPELRRRGHGLLVITHDLAYVREVDRFVEICDGKLVDSAPFRDDEKVKFPEILKSEV